MYGFRVFPKGLLLQVNKEIPFFQKIIDVIVCGQVITTDTLYSLAQIRNGISSSFSSILKLITSIKVSFSKKIRKSEIFFIYHYDIVYS